MNKVRKTIVGALSIGFLILLGAGPAPDAAAQTPTPCATCGPSGQRGDGTRAYGFATFHCAPKSFTATMGVGSRVPLPQTISWRVTHTGTHQILDAGSHTFVAGAPREITTGLVAADAGHVEVAWTSTVPFYNPDSQAQPTFRTQMVDCECDQPPTTPPTTTPPTSPPSSAPGTPGTVPPGVTVPPPSTPGGDFELPATGSNEWLALGGALIVFLGVCALLFGRGSRVEP